MKKWLIILVLLLTGCTVKTHMEEQLVKQSDLLDIEMGENTIGFIIPLYLYPNSDYSEYERIMSIKTEYPELPVIVIINPYNGPGEYDKYYESLVKDLKDHKITMIGYIHVSYGERSLLDLEKDINTFVELYPEIEGFFVDEVESDSRLNYYNMIRTLAGERDFIVGNPGTEVDKSYFDVFDVIIVSETSYNQITEERLTTSNLNKVSNNQKGVISYETDDEISALWLTEYVNWIYITEYDTYKKLSNKFEELSKIIDESNRG